MKKPVAIAFVLMLVGCATFQVDEAVVRPDSIRVGGSPAQRALTVNEITTTSNFKADKIFEQALKQSLANQGVLSGENAANYRLAVRITRWDTPGLSDFGFERRSYMTAKYTISSATTGEHVWSRTVESTYDAPRVYNTKKVKLEAGSERDRELGYPQPGTRLGAGGEQRIQIANAATIRINIARFLEAYSRYLATN